MQSQNKYQIASHFQQEQNNFGFDNIDNEDADVSYSLYDNSRKQFVKKVYTILMIQLLITMGFILLNTFNQAFNDFQYNHFFVVLICIPLSIGIPIALVCSPQLCKNYPTNIILLGVFTFSQSYLVSIICGIYQPISVLQTIVATSGATFGITIYAWTTKYDFTNLTHYCYGLGWCFVMIIIWMTFLNFFFLSNNNILTCIYAALFAIIYSIYIVVDTQLIMGRENIKLSMDNYVLGSIILYFDIIGLFLQLLRIIGDKRK